MAARAKTKTATKKKAKPAPVKGKGKATKPAAKPAGKKEPAAKAKPAVAAKSSARAPAAKKAVAAKSSARAPAAKKAAKKPPAAKPAPAKKVAAKKAAAPRRARKATSQLSLPGFSDAGDGDEAAAPSRSGRGAGAPSRGAADADAGDHADADDETASAERAAHIAQVAAARALDVDPTAPVRLGTVTAPSGALAIFDVALMGYLPREALEPLVITTAAPADRALAVIATRVGKGRFADCWDHVAIELAPTAPDVPTRARKLGEAAVDFARLLVIDRAAIDHWQHEDSLDQLADFVFWGRDEGALAKATGARRLPEGHHGWRDLPLAEAEARADRAAELKAEHGWQLASEVRPHSHHFAALASARESGRGAGTIEVGGAHALLFFTSWGDGVFPVFLDLDPEDRPVRLRIQLAPRDLSA